MVDNGYKISEVICVKCAKRWIAVRPEETLLKDIECEHCGAGFVIETGQVIDDEKQECLINFS